MVAYATPAWVGALDGALRDGQPPATEALTISCAILDGPEGDLEYRIVVDESGARAMLGPGPADVRFTQHVTVARAVADGSLRARDAVIAGELAVSGRVEVLERARALLEWIGARTATMGSAD